MEQNCYTLLLQTRTVDARLASVRATIYSNSHPSSIVIQVQYYFFSFPPTENYEASNFYSRRNFDCGVVPNTCHGYCKQRNSPERATSFSFLRNESNGQPGDPDQRALSRAQRACREYAQLKTLAKNFATPCVIACARNGVQPLQGSPYVR